MGEGDRDDVVVGEMERARYNVFMICSGCMCMEVVGCWT